MASQGGAAVAAAPASASLSSSAQGIFADKYLASRKRRVLTAILYFVLFAVAIIVGATGPTAIASTLIDNPTRMCSDPTACTVSWTGKMTNITPFNQFMSLLLTLDRPVTTAGQPVAPNALIEFDQVFTLQLWSMDADGSNMAPIGINSTHTRRIVCRPGEHSCRPIMLSYVSHLTYPVLQAQVGLVNPQASFVFPGAPALSTLVSMHFRAGFVSSEYTNFSLGWRYFLVTSSALFFLYYSYRLCCSRVRKSEGGQWLSATTEQKWVWLLGLFLVLFNDPGYVAQITVPQLPLTLFYAICLVTFLCLLLLFWLIAFHTTALQGEFGFHWGLGLTQGSSGSGSSSNSNGGVAPLGACFWIPKIILITLYWAIAVSGYVWTRWQQMTDPAYSLYEQAQQQAGELTQYFFGFAYFLGACYLLFIFSLMVMACRKCRKMRSGSSFFLGITLSTLIVVLAGVFANSFTPLRGAAGSILAVYAAPNLYVWLLLLSYLPTPPLSHEELREMGGKAYEEEVDTTGVMGVSAAASSSSSSSGALSESLDVALEDVESALEPALDEDGKPVLIVRGRAAQRRLASSMGMSQQFAIEEEEEEQQQQQTSPAAAAAVTTAAAPSAASSAAAVTAAASTTAAAVPAASAAAPAVAAAPVVAAAPRNKMKRKDTGIILPDVAQAAVKAAAGSKKGGSSGSAASGGSARLGALPPVAASSFVEEEEDGEEE